MLLSQRVVVRNLDYVQCCFTQAKASLDILKEEIKCKGRIKQKELGGY